MADSDVIIEETEIRAELDEQRCLIEAQHVSLQRQKRLMEVQLQFAGTLQADLDALKAILRSALSPPQPERPTNGNGHDTAHQLMAEAMASGDRT